MPNQPDSPRSTGVPPVSYPDLHGRDAHVTELPGVSTLSTGVPPVSEPTPDAHVTGDTFRIRHGAKLPHWRQGGAIYAVTFRLADSVPRHVLEGWRLEREEIEQAAIQKAGRLTAMEAHRLKILFSDKVEDYLNTGHGASWMMREAVANSVHKALLHFDGARYD